MQLLAGMGPAAEAPTHLEAAPSPSTVTLRAGAGLGAGTNGLAGSVFAALDVWPWLRWGIGLEGSTGGSSSGSLAGDSRKGSLLAVRLRFAARLAVSRSAYFSGALAAGLANQSSSQQSAVPGCSGTFESDCSYVPVEAAPLGDYRHEGTVPSGALELAFQGHLAGPLEIGLFLRGEAGPEVAFVTFGPLLGARF